MTKSLESAKPSSAQRKPVVLQIIPSLGAGGAEQGCIDVAAELVKAGATSIVVSHGGYRVPEILRAGSIHIDLPAHSKNPWVMWRNVARLKKIIQQYQVDIVHARSRAPAWSAWAACQNNHSHFMTTCHAPFNISGKYKRLYNSSITRGERVIAISEYVKNYLLENYDILEQNIRLIHRGIAPEKFHPAAVSGASMIQLSKEWRLPDGCTIVMMPGRITRWKGHHILIDAMSKIPRDDLFCVMVGDDQGRSEYRNELETAILQKGLEGRVRIVPQCKDMPAAYLLSNLVISASIEPEGFGRVPIEAQAMGRPVIATAHGGAMETILDGQTGWLVPPNDSDALAKAIETALSLSDEVRGTMAQAGMDHVSRHFTRAHMVDQTLNVYAELLQPRFHSASSAPETPNKAA